MLAVASKTAKYVQIKEHLKAQVLSGFYADSAKLPTCRKLSKVFDASLVTVSNAVKLLEQEGYVRCIQGNGIFVNPAELRKCQQLKQVGFIIPTNGDLYHKFFSKILSEIAQINMLATPLSTTAILETFSEKDLDSCFERYANSGFASLIVDGDREFPFKSLQRISEKLEQLTFVMHCDSEIEFPKANKILCDYRKVGYLAAEHLIKQGKHRIGLLVYYPMNELDRRRKGSLCLAHDMEVLSGIEDAFKDAGLQSTGIQLIYDSPLNIQDDKRDAEIEKFITQGLCGFIAMGDGRVPSVYRLAEKVGLTIGKDLGIVGLYNTHWVSELHPLLTSISINEVDIALLAIQSIKEKWCKKTVLVEPKLIVRNSSLA